MAEPRRKYFHFGLPTGPVGPHGAHAGGRRMPAWAGRRWAGGGRTAESTLKLKTTSNYESKSICCERAEIPDTAQCVVFQETFKVVGLKG